MVCFQSVSKRFATRWLNWLLLLWSGNKKGVLADAFAILFKNFLRRAFAERRRRDRPQPIYCKPSICAATSITSEKAALGNGAMRRMIFALSTPAMPRTFTTDS